MITTGARGGAFVSGDEEMEDQVKMEETSTSNVVMLPGHGTFMSGTADDTVTQVRDSVKCHRATVNVSEDLLNRLIQDDRHQQVHSPRTNDTNKGQTCGQDSGCVKVVLLELRT